ncbi:hypothetical protein PO909_023222 [Leuciscus waleckii]
MIRSSRAYLNTRATDVSNGCCLASEMHPGPNQQLPIGSAELFLSGCVPMLSVAIFGLRLRLLRTVSGFAASSAPSQAPPPPLRLGLCLLRSVSGSASSAPSRALPPPLRLRLRLLRTISGSASSAQSQAPPPPHGLRLRLLTV